MTVLIAVLLIVIARRPEADAAISCRLGAGHTTIPMIVVGRLAIEQGWQGRGLGKLLLRDAVLRIRRAAAIIGVRGLLVHAPAPAAKRFHEDNGFVESPANKMTLLVALKDALAPLAGKK